MASSRAVSAQQATPSEPALPELIDRHELSRRTGIPVRRIKQWTLERVIPHYRVNRTITLYDPAEIGAWLATLKQEPVEFAPPNP